MAAIPDAATVVAVPDPMPPTTAPAMTAGTAWVRAAEPYPRTASARPIRASVRGPTRSTREASRNPAAAELNSSALPTAPACVADSGSPASRRPTVVGRR
jgi:hypothetical protein